MREQLIAYLEAVQVGNNQEILCKKIAEYLLGCNTEFLVENSQEVAELFYQYLCALQKLYGDEASVIAGSRVEKVFKAVALINTNEETMVENDSNLMAVRFLSQLYSAEADDYSETVQEQLLLEAAPILLEGLEDIYCIFKIECDGRVIFPINRLIAKVIKSPDFVNISRISQQHIRILQLAVQLFRSTSDSEIIEELRNTCQLRFLDFLDGTQSLIDTRDMKNYQLNGVMVFHNSNYNKVLIRHEKKEYFKCADHNVTFEEGVELNYHGEPIGYYREYDLGDASLVDYHYAINEQPREFLKILYDKGCYNIFLEKMLVKNADGTLQVLNPFCVNDKYIVRGKLACQCTERYYNRSEVEELLLGYQLKCVSGKLIDWIPFGLCLNLLTKENIGTELLLQENALTDWKQNKIIYNWVVNGVDPKRICYTF